GRGLADRTGDDPPELPGRTGDPMAFTKSRAARGVGVLAVSLWSSLAAAQSASVPARARSLYTVVELRGRGAGSLTFARAMNASGQVVGRSGHPNGTDTRAILWTSGIAEDLGTLPGGDYSSASAINRAGEVVGTSNTATSVRAFRWTRSGGMRDLGALPGD